MRESVYEQRAKCNNSDEEQTLSEESDALYRATLKDLYIEILKFQANVIKHMSKNGAFRLGLDMIKWQNWESSDIQTKEADLCKLYDLRKDLNAERDFEKILAYHREEIENLSSISYNTSSLLYAIQEQQADRKRTELLNWLSSVDSSKLYNSGLDKIRTGTGEWLLTGNKIFEQWKLSPNSFIWLNGKGIITL
jgi:hypothetical protein